MATGFNRTQILPQNQNALPAKPYLEVLITSLSPNSGQVFIVTPVD